nr:immunoglobulin light chain junction region [Macaca mulatta]
CQQHHTYPPTF